MKSHRTSHILACLVAGIGIVGTTSVLAAADSVDFKQFVKAGSYAMSIKVAGTQASSAPPATIFCVTDEQLAKNQFLDFNAATQTTGTSCKLNNVKQGKDTLNYDIVCDKEGLTASNAMTFANGNIKGTTKSKLTGEKAGGLPATMRDFSVEFDVKYLGTCKK